MGSLVLIPPIWAATDPYSSGLSATIKLIHYRQEAGHHLGKSWYAQKHHFFFAKLRGMKRKGYEE
jgi:hypothetical protein